MSEAGSTSTDHHSRPFLRSVRRVANSIINLGSDEPWIKQPTAIIMIVLLLGATTYLTYVAYRSPIDLRNEQTISKRADELAPSLRLDINSATLEQLEAIPQIGPALAGRIIDDRKTSGPFPTVDSLTRVKGIGERTVEIMRPYITAQINLQAQPSQ